MHIQRLHPCWDFIRCVLAASLALVVPARGHTAQKLEVGKTRQLITDKIIPISEARLRELEAPLKSLRRWLENDPMRRARPEPHDYERGWDDGWDAARERVRKMLEVRSTG